MSAGECLGVSHCTEFAPNDQRIFPSFRISSLASVQFRAVGCGTSLQLTEQLGDKTKVHSNLRFLRVSSRLPISSNRWSAADSSHLLPACLCVPEIAESEPPLGDDEIPQLLERGALKCHRGICACFNRRSKANRPGQHMVDEKLCYRPL